MKNVQVIDGAANSTFEIYEINDEMFQKMFRKTSDIAFIEDLKEYEEKEQNPLFWQAFYSTPVDKKDVNGIHGTLHLEKNGIDRKFFPDRTAKNVITDFFDI